MGFTRIDNDFKINGTLNINTIGTGSFFSYLGVDQEGNVVDGGSSSFNFSNTDLTFTGNREHNTNGNFFQLTTDGVPFNQGWFIIDPGYVNMGYGSTSLYLDTENYNIIFDGVTRIRNMTTETIINDSGSDFNFRVEGTSDESLIFVNASTDKVGVGINEPTSKLHINGDLRIETIGSTTPSTILSTDASGNVVDGSNLINNQTLRDTLQNGNISNGNDLIISRSDDFNLLGGYNMGYNVYDSTSSITRDTSVNLIGGTTDFVLTLFTSPTNGSVVKLIKISGTSSNVEINSPDKSIVKGGTVSNTFVMSGLDSVTLHYNDISGYWHESK